MNQIVQGSQGWLMARLGLVTASRISDVVARTKSGYSASRANYLAQLVAERLTGEPTETFSSTAMQWGVDHEADARAAYEFFTDQTVEDGGFVPHPAIAMSGASPDGLVGEDGLVEIKCPNTATHLEYLMDSSVPGKYVAQMQWQMACTGRDWCDFVSFDPRLPPQLSLHVRRLARDEAHIATLEGEVRGFIEELNGICGALLDRFAVPSEAA
jgi:putative phage-type endonuclease